ncbi:MAG: [protein-PII] uridylyltransferase [Deltaproteobacteria bacterium]|nr:[protein-PII] uridylyltransferase [Deltaproteobacteria bacterium]
MNQVTAIKKSASPAENLSHAKHRLLSRGLPEDAPGFLAAHARIIDDYFVESYEKSQVGPSLAVAKNPYALVALGGYGRREQCIHSDVDLLILFDGRVPPEATRLVHEVVYPLWDLGLEISPATRSLKEAVKLACKDYEILTPLLDARFVCGASRLYSRLQDELDGPVLKKHAKSYLEWMVATGRSRHARYGDTTHILEPHLKEGPGGLRDYHSILWMGRVLSGARSMDELCGHGILTADELAGLRKSLAFVWKVRNHLHLASGRKNDMLYLDYQKKLAQSLGFADEQDRAGIERFLSVLSGHMDRIHELYQATVRTAAPERSSKRKNPETFAEGIRLDKEGLDFASPRTILASPLSLARIFSESARLGVRLSLSARRRVRESVGLITDSFRSDPLAVSAFETVLRAAPTESADALEEMRDTGYLSAFIPEFAGIVHLVQFTEYHLYPTDTHSLMTVRILKDFARSDDTLVSDVFRDVSPKRVLYLAGLLHDVGKGVESADENHSTAGARLVKTIMERMGYPDTKIETVQFLVREHLLMAKTASRRDLNDEETILAFSRKVGGIMNLRMLYLLSLADTMATGPNANTEWTRSLLRELFSKAYRTLASGDMVSGNLASKRNLSIEENKRREFLALLPVDFSEKEGLDLFGKMSPRYRHDISASDMAAHALLWRRLSPAVPAVLAAGKSQSDNLRTVTVAANDAPGLFSRIAGALSLHGISILDAEIYTWHNGCALDVFRVSPPPDALFEKETWVKVEKDLVASIKGELDLFQALERRSRSDTKCRAATALGEPERVRVDNRSSSFFTIVEVFADDRPGLLHGITRVLFQEGLDIRVAKISTKSDRVVDVFYVRDTDGQKLDGQRSEAVRRRLQEALDEASGKT